MTYLTAGSRAGLLFNSTKFYIGYSINLLNRTKTEDEVFRNRGFYSDVQIGYTFYRNTESVSSFTPQLVISIEKDWYTNRVVIRVQGYNASFRYKQFIWGLNDGGILLLTRGNADRNLSELGGIHIGWQTDKFRVMLTNSYSNSNNIGYRYTANLSSRYILGSKDQRPGRGW
jgi:hypothetical protein